MPKNTKRGEGYKLPHPLIMAENIEMKKSTDLDSLLIILFSAMLLTAMIGALVLRYIL